jgi:CHASE3 domain sensor protein
VLKKISDLRSLIRRAESTARGFVLTDDPGFVNEYRDSHDRIAPALAELIAMTRDNPTQTRLLESSEPLIARRLGVSDEIVRLHVPIQSERKRL